MKRNNISGIAVFIILVAATITIVAYTVANGSAPVGPPTPVPGSGGIASLIGENNLTPVSTFTTLNAGDGLTGTGSGSRFTLNVITPTPQPTATPGGVVLNNQLPVPDGSTPSNTNYIGIPGVNFTQSGGAFLVANDIYLEMWQTFESITINRVSFEVTSAGNPGDACRIGLYEADINWQPGDLVADWGQIVNDSTGWKHATVSTVVTPGNYLTATLCNTGPALRGYTGKTYFSGLVDSTTTSSTRFVNTVRVSAPTAGQYAGGYVDPGDAWDTVDLAATINPGYWILLRWTP